MKKATNIIKDIKKSFSDRAYHSRHKKDALKVLKTIESVKGKTNKKLIKQSDKYAIEVLGWKGYAPWLYVYCAINKEFKEGWIPDNYYGRVIVPKLKGNYGAAIANCNSLTNRIFNSPNFPDCAYYTNGLWISRDYRVLSDKELTNIIFAQNSKLVYKIDSSLQGKGVFFLEEDNFNIEDIKKLGNGVFQKYIKQHSFFHDIMPNSVVTLRVTSIIDNKGAVTVNACFLRAGRKADTHVKSSSQIKVSVDPTTGRLHKYGYTTDWLEIEKHPDTGFLFENKQIPEFQKIIDTAVNLHKKVPFTRTIGWDMTVDIDNNVKVMEWNGGHNGIKFTEATQGPSFSNLGWENLWKENI